jgi:uncharacterized protein (DUF1697 family)
LLRGINVTGRNQIKMADLTALFAGLGHEDVSTYVQSGNVIFRSASGSSVNLANDIAERIKRDLGLDVAVLLRTQDQLAKIVKDNPFIRNGADLATLHVTFLAESPDPALVREIDSALGEPDEFRVAGREVYLHCPNGYGRTKLNNTFWERRLKVAATTRNWRTVTTLHRLAGSSPAL